MEHLLRELAALREAAAKARERAEALAVILADLDAKIRAAAEAQYELNHDKQIAPGLEFVVVEETIRATIATDLRKFYPEPSFPDPLLPQGEENGND